MNLVNNINFWDKPTYVPLLEIDTSLRHNLEPSICEDYNYNSYFDGWDSSLITLSGDYDVSNGALILNTTGKITFNKNINNPKGGRVTIKESEYGTYSIDGGANTTFNAGTWHRNKYCENEMEVVSGTSKITNMVYRSLEEERNSYFSVTPGAFTFALQEGYSVDYRGKQLYRSIDNSKKFGLNYANLRKQSIKYYWATQYIGTYLLNRYSSHILPYVENSYNLINSTYISLPTVSINNDQLTFLNDLSLNVYGNLNLSFDVSTSQTYNIDLYKDPIPSAGKEGNITITCGDDEDNLHTYNLNINDDLPAVRQFKINSSQNKNLTFNNPIDWSKFSSLENVNLNFLDSSVMNLSLLDNSCYNLPSDDYLYLTIFFRNDVDTSIDVSKLDGIDRYVLVYRNPPSEVRKFRVKFANTKHYISNFSIGYQYGDDEDIIDNDWELPSVMANPEDKPVQWLFKYGFNKYRIPDIDLSTLTTSSNIQFHFEAYDMSLGKIIPPTSESGSLRLYFWISDKHTKSTPVWDCKLDIEDINRLDICESSFSIDFQGNDPSDNVFPQETVDKLTKFKSVNLGSEAISPFYFPKDISSNLKTFSWYVNRADLGYHTYDTAFYLPDSNYTNIRISSFHKYNLEDVNLRTQDSDTFVSTNYRFENSYYGSSDTIYKTSRIYYPNEVRSGYENNHSFGEIQLRQTIDLLQIPIGVILIAGKIELYPRTISAYLVKKIYDNYESFKPRPASTNQHTEDFTKTLAFQGGNTSLIKGGYSKPKNYIQADPSTVGNDGIFSIPAFVQETSICNIYNTKDSNTDYAIDASFYTDVSYNNLIIKVKRNNVVLNEILVGLQANYPMKSFTNGGDQISSSNVYPQISGDALYYTYLHNISSSDGNVEFPVVPDGNYKIHVWDISTGGQETMLLSDYISINNDSSLNFEVNDYKKISLSSPIIKIDGNNSSRQSYSIFTNGAQQIQYIKDDIFVKDGSNYGVIGFWTIDASGNDYVGFEDFEYEVSTGTVNLQFTVDISSNNYVDDVFQEYGTYWHDENSEAFVYGVNSRINKTKKNSGIFTRDNYQRLIYSDSSYGNQFLTFDNSISSSSYTYVYTNSSNVNLHYNDGGIYGSHTLILYHQDPSRGEVPFRALQYGNYYQLYYNFGIENVTKVKMVGSNIQHSAYASQIAHTLLNQKKDNTDILKYRWSITST